MTLGLHVKVIQMWFSKFCYDSHIWHLNSSVCYDSHIWHLNSSVCYDSHIWHLNSSVALLVGFHDKRMVVLPFYLASCFVVLPQHVNDPLDLDTIQYTGILCI